MQLGLPVVGCRGGRLGARIYAVTMTTTTLEQAVQTCLELDAIVARLRQSLLASVASARDAEPSRSSWQVDRGGEELQDCALQVALLMGGRAPTDECKRELIGGLRAHDGDERVASFLQRWAQLLLVTGAVATGNDAPRLAYADWYRGAPGECCHMPSLASLRDGEDGLERFVLHGWLPRTPPIRRDSRVTALGSCFADEVRIWLRERGIAVNADFRTAAGSYPHVEDAFVPLLQCAAGLVNTFVLRQQFEWALDGADFDDDLWHGARGSVTVPTELARRRTRELFERTDVFVITLGLSEVWFKRRADAEGEGEGPGREAAHNVLWRAVPARAYSRETHGFRVASVAENVANLRAVLRLVWRAQPHATVLLTLSPIPLTATFRGVSCVTANAVSKASLRAAIDECMREREHADACARGQLLYWPAYEMIKEGVVEPYLPDGRHVRPEVVQRVLALFGKHYVVQHSRGDVRAAPASANKDDTMATSDDESDDAEVTRDQRGGRNLSSTRSRSHSRSP